MATLLTKRQNEILNYIRKSLEKEGYPPTFREIAAYFNFSGPRAAEKHLLSLERKGYIRKGKGARAIKILEQTSQKSGVMLPILGQVAAGLPILAEENIMGHLTVDLSIVKKENSYLLKVKGDSMRDAAILDGDYILVNPQPDAETGQIVIAMIEDEVTVKRFIRRNNRIILQPQNPAFRPIVITEETRNFKILGVSGGIIRFH